MNADFKLLSNYEKAILIFDRHFSFIPARELCVVYLKALRNNNRSLVDHFESFGDCVNSMIFKKMDFDNDYRNTIVIIEKTEFGQLKLDL